MSADQMTARHTWRSDKWIKKYKIQMHVNIYANMHAHTHAHVWLIMSTMAHVQPRLICTHVCT